MILCTLNFYEQKVDLFNLLQCETATLRPVTLRLWTRDECQIVHKYVLEV